MLRKFVRGIQRAAQKSDVEVSESNGVRSLHLGSSTIQSSMRLQAPFELELAYTRGMMSFLLFSDKIRHVLMIGLGGGSIPKYIHHHLPEITTHVVEINPQVIRVGRSQFMVPEDDARFSLIEGDGIEYLNGNQDSAQLLMIDAFDSNGIPSDMGSQEFFDSCAAALVRDGMMAMNLWGSDRNFDIYLQRIEQSFDQRVLMLPTGRPGNIVVFGFKRAPADLRWVTLRERAKALEATHGIEFLNFVEKLREHNPGTGSRLLLDRE
jgi:spermidine synthase